MRTPNSKCCICGKLLYRRPCELKKVRYVACIEHRAEAQRLVDITEAQKIALEKGRQKGTNHLTGISKSKESNRKRSDSHKRWCKENPDKVKERAKKIRGQKHYNWKGGASRLNISIRQLTENRKWMENVKKRDTKCVCCGSTDTLESHHIIPLELLISKNGIKNREQARLCHDLWKLENGITVCQKCHYKIHGRKYANK